MEMTTKMKIKSLKCVKKSIKLQENAKKALKIPDTYTKLTTTHVITFPESRSSVKMVSSLKLDQRLIRPPLSSLVSSLLHSYSWLHTFTT